MVIRAKYITINIEGNFIMTKVQTHKEGITILSDYACNIRTSKYMTQKLEHYQLDSVGIYRILLQQWHNTFFSSIYETFAKQDYSLCHKTSLMDSSHTKNILGPHTQLVVQLAFIRSCLATKSLFLPLYFPPCCLLHVRIFL